MWVFGAVLVAVARWVAVVGVLGGCWLRKDALMVLC